ncbi:hypothetical protein SAMN05660860_02388 [Geoalkalibacter ferrihydriticus]|uniref:Uncharacterized protein n=2 Tax=Geoalkalibacter ferrihydriticus TaxID=392333 RepID=A0A0C2HYX5_9BACT|nr:hypothetical protein [Geoalkalibacter ferrihydriticus]KIH77957.1 hypothetical protein GFER_04930 [Geoalkalibacter ferrihydriticus DSM 17813]SDM35419.1 hypothetical protein SAMN05660860_02388 [Geoalkalibacter ferrihydriticus]
MFGFGFLEIGLLILLLVVLFGARRAGDMLRRGMEIHGQVNRARSDLRSFFSIDTLLGRNRDRKP